MFSPTASINSKQVSFSGCPIKVQLVDKKQLDKINDNLGKLCTDLCDGNNLMDESGEDHCAYIK